MEHRTQSDLRRADFTAGDNATPSMSMKVSPSEQVAGTPDRGHMIGGGYGAPVDGTSGTLGFIKGGLYCDFDGGTLHVNSGTSASPTWGVVTVT